MQQKITEEFLLKNGYKEYEPSEIYGEFCKKAFQKCITENNVRKYFINLKKWEFPDVTQWEAEIQFYSRGSHRAMDVVFHNGWSLETIERYAQKIYEVGFEPYDREEV